MNRFASLRKQLQSDVQPVCQGQWRAISMRLDEYTDEYLNVGVMFCHAGKVEVRMLDTFDRVKCLYGDRVDLPSLTHLMLDIEDTVQQSQGDLPSELSDTIRLGPQLFASGENAEEVVDDFFNDVVTLGKPTSKKARTSFRYRSNFKVRETVFELMREKMSLEAETIIRQDPYRLRLNNTALIDVDIPLLNAKAAGTIVSAWYKSPLVVENNLLQAASDLLLVYSNSDRRKAAMSVLMPAPSSGLTNREFQKHDHAAHRQLERLERSGIDILKATASDELADLTIGWWQNVA